MGAVVLGRMYRVPAARLPAGWEKREWAALTRVTPYSPPGYGPPPASFRLGHVDAAGDWRIPKFLGLSLFGPPDRDVRSLGLPMHERCIFTGCMQTGVRDQVAAHCASLGSLRACGGALLVLPCGFGKTVVSIAVAASLGRKTLVLVHTGQLFAQWPERIAEFAPGARVGGVREGRCDVEERDFVIAMIQTLQSRRFPPEFYAQFGTTIVDEAHHTAARTFCATMEEVSSRFILGLTATPERADRLSHIVNWELGPEAFRARRPADAAVRVRTVVYRGGAREVVMQRNGNVCMSSMYNKLAEEKARTAFIVRLIENILQSEPRRQLLVLTHRVAHVEELRSALQSALQSDGCGSVACLRTGLKGAEREAAMCAQGIVSTYQLCSEGMDIPSRNTLVLATPKSRVEQTVGRIQRSTSHREGECTPLVLDVVDPFSVFAGMARARARHYADMGYTVVTQ